MTEKNVVAMLNAFRKEQGLPAVNRPVKITPSMKFWVARDVWETQYPRSVKDADFELGELTLGLVQQEVEKRLRDIRLGIVPKTGYLKDYLP